MVVFIMPFMKDVCGKFPWMLFLSFLASQQVSFSISPSLLAYFPPEIFSPAFSLPPLSFPDFFFSPPSPWNRFLTCAAVIQGPPGLPGLKGDPGSKGEKVGVSTYHCECLQGAFISPHLKRRDKQTWGREKKKTHRGASGSAQPAGRSVGPQVSCSFATDKTILGCTES